MDKKEKIKTVMVVFYVLFVFMTIISGIVVAYCVIQAILHLLSFNVLIEYLTMALVFFIVGTVGFCLAKGIHYFGEKADIFEKDSWKFIF